MSRFFLRLLIVLAVLAQLAVPAIISAQATQERAKVHSGQASTSNRELRDQRNGTLRLLSKRTEALIQTLNSGFLKLESSVNEIRMEVIKLQPSTLVTWSAALSGIAALFSVFVAFISVRIARTIAKDTTKLTRYTYLANKWYDIKERELNNPKFTDPAYTRGYSKPLVRAESKKYHILAWMCWGHAEDIFDGGLHKDPGFAPTIREYKRLHITWLLDEDNRTNFRKEFVDYIESL